MLFTSAFLYFLSATFASAASITPQAPVACGVERLQGTLSITGPRTDSTAVGFVSNYDLTDASRDAGVSANAAFHAGTDLVLTSTAQQQPVIFEAWDCAGQTDKDATSFKGQIYHAGACLTRVFVEKVTFVTLSDCAQPATTLTPVTLPSNQTFIFTQMPTDKKQYKVEIPTTAARSFNRGRDGLKAVTLSTQDIAQEGLIFKV